MSDPLSFVPLALAAADGAVDGVSCRQLAASGVALLQRTAPLVRALDGRRAAILLPIGPAFVVALAACAGRAAVLLDERDDADGAAGTLLAQSVGAVFTRESLAARLPPELPRVVLDHAPTRAEWWAAGRSRSIDLALHGGLLLEGDPETEGSDEVALLRHDRARTSNGAVQLLSHRLLLEAARAVIRAQRLDHRAHAHTLASPAGADGLIAGCLAPLLAGGRVSTGAANDVAAIVERIEHDTVTTLVAPPHLYMAIADACSARGYPLDAPLLQHCIAGESPIDGALVARWRTACAVELAPQPPLDGAPPTGSPRQGA